MSEPYSIRGVFPMGNGEWDGELWKAADARQINAYYQRLMNGAERNYPTGQYRVEIRLRNGQLVRVRRRFSPYE